MNAPTLLRNRVSAVKESLPYAFCLLFMVAYPLVSFYWAAVDFAWGYLTYGLYYILGGLFCLWLFLPNIAAHALRLYSLWQSPNCDYYRLDGLLTRSIRAMKLFRCPAVSSLYPELATLKMYEGQYSEAENLFSITLGELANGRWRDAPQLIVYECTLASIYSRQNRREDFQTELEKAFNRVEKCGEKAGLHSAYALLFRSASRFDQADLVEAKADLEVVLDKIRNSKPTVDFPKLNFDRLKSSAYLVAAAITLKLNDVESANKFCSEFFQLATESCETLTPLAVKWLNLLAAEYIHIERLGDAEKLLNLAYSMLVKVPNHPDGQQTLHQFRELLMQTGREQEIEDMTFPPINGQ